MTATATQVRQGASRPIDPCPQRALWPQSHLQERIAKACRIIRERGGEVEFGPDEADAHLSELRKAQRVLGNLVKRAEAAKQRRPDEALPADELAAIECEAAQLELGRSSL
ncbi:MAG: hypothetical protein ACJ75S_04010 [Solirubrobacterales bacterium]